MKVTNCDSTNTVKHTNLHWSIRKYGRNSSEVVNLTAYPLTPVTKDSELYNFTFTKETKQSYTGLNCPLRHQEIVAGRISRLLSHEGSTLTALGSGRFYQSENTAETLIC
jgi:hypothetical protein